MKLTRSIAAALLFTISAGVLAGCFVESGRSYRHRHVIVVR